MAVRDQADSDGTNNGTSTPDFTGIEAPDGFENEFTATFEASEDNICAAEDVDDCGADDPETETELEFVAIASEAGAFSNPFDRLDFWVEDVNGASWLLGSDTSGSSDRVGGPGTDARNRTWTYSLDASAADLHMLTREAGFPPTGDTNSDTGHTVRAFAVNDDGIALVRSVDLTIDDGEADN